MKAKSFIAPLFLSVLSFVLLFTAAPLFSEDEHFIDDEHYFIASEKLKQGWIRVDIATLKTPATAETKNEAEFTKISSGEDVWTKFYWQTKVLKKEGIKIGVEVISFDATDNDGLYRIPENKDETLAGSWFMAKITDVSDLYKGYVTVSGGYKVRIDNMRVVVKIK